MAATDVPKASAQRRHSPCTAELFCQHLLFAAEWQTSPKLLLQWTSRPMTRLATTRALQS